MKYSILLDRARIALSARLPEAIRVLTYRYGSYRFVWYPIVKAVRPK